MKCLCCNKEIDKATEYERQTRWHEKCVNKFFGTRVIPEINLSNKELERLADKTVNKGLTVPGVQKKLSLHLQEDTSGPRFTLVDYPTGYILKPQSNEYKNLPEAEFLIMKLAELVRIATVPNALIKINDSYAYITKRIDRQNGKIYAMEDFCQLTGRITYDKYKGSYEQCGKVIDRFSKNIGLDKSELFKRLVFCFITGNSDMHLKNFSLIENSPAGRIFGLSPAYDLLPVNIILPEDKDQMALTLNGKNRNIKAKDFWTLAENYGIAKNTAIKITNDLIKQKDRMVDEVRHSLLSEAMKDSLIELIKNRLAVFS